MKLGTISQIIFLGALGSLGAAGIRLAMGSVPSQVPTHVTNDSAIYQNLSEIRVQKQPRVNFDSEIDQLTTSESAYRENIQNASRLDRPMQRIVSKKYRYSGQNSHSHSQSAGMVPEAYRPKSNLRSYHVARASHLRPKKSLAKPRMVQMLPNSGMPEDSFNSPQY